MNIKSSIRALRRLLPRQSKRSNIPGWCLRPSRVLQRLGNTDLDLQLKRHVIHQIIGDDNGEEYCRCSS